MTYRLASDNVLKLYYLLSLQWTEVEALVRPQILVQIHLLLVVAWPEAHHIPEAEAAHPSMMKGEAVEVLHTEIQHMALPIVPAFVT